MWRKSVFDIYFSEIGAALTTVLPGLFKYCYKYCYSDSRKLSRNERGRFVALKSDSSHHFFRNACTKSGSLRFSQFSVVDWFCLFIYLWVLTRSSVILLLPLFTLLYCHIATLEIWGIPIIGHMRVTQCYSQWKWRWWECEHSLCWFACFGKSDWMEIMWPIIGFPQISHSAVYQ